MNEVLQTIRNRRSVRRYLDVQIKRDELQTILDAAILAPTACNEQPWHFTIVQNKELLQEISEKTLDEMRESPEKWIQDMGNRCKSVFYGAPTVIIVSGKKKAYSSLTDCSAAIENMLIAAESINIGSVWIGLTDHYFNTEKDYREKLNIPKGYDAFYTVALGYKQNNAIKPVPERNKNVFNFIE